MELSFTSLGLTSVTAFAWMLFGAINKKIADVAPPAVIIGCVFALHIPFLASWVLWTGNIGIADDYYLPFLAVVAITAVSNLLLIKAFSLSPFSLIAPLFGLTPLFTSLLGVFFLNELLSLQQWVGILFVGLGILWLFAPPDNPWRVSACWHRLRREPGAPIMLIVTLMWSFGLIFDKMSMRHTSPEMHAFLSITMAAALLLIYAICRGQMKSLALEKKHWPFFLAAGFLGAFAQGLQLLAVQITPAGIFEAAKRIFGQSFALILGATMLKEPITKPKIIGLAILTIGIPLIVL
jgi:uncharacterized membrane protein